MPPFPVPHSNALTTSSGHQSSLNTRAESWLEPLSQINWLSGDPIKLGRAEGWSSTKINNGNNFIQAQSDVIEYSDNLSEPKRIKRALAPVKRANDKVLVARTPATKNLPNDLAAYDKDEIFNIILKGIEELDDVNGRNAQFVFDEEKPLSPIPEERPLSPIAEEDRPLSIAEEDKPLSPIIEEE